MRKIRWFDLGLWGLTFLFLWLNFSLVASVFLDPDFGWHLKTGGWIWGHQVLPRRDLFSYSMPDYAWLSHTWLGDLIIFKLYPFWGYAGLAVFFSFWVSLAFLVLVPPRMIKAALVPTLLVGAAALAHADVRPLVLSFPPAAILLLVVRKSFLSQKWLWVIPVVFWAWVNVHASFPIGLGLLALALVERWKRGRTLKDKRVFWIWVLVAVVSVMATFFNPYGRSIYRFIFSEMVAGQKAHFAVVEWQPFHRLDLGVIFYLGLFWAFFWIWKARCSWFEKALLLLTGVAGFWSARLMIYFLIFSLPFLTEFFEVSYRTYSKEVNFQKLWRYRRSILGAIFVFSAFSGLLVMGEMRGLSEKAFYPVGAVEFLRQEAFPGRLFSTYNWGGYLIWKLPEKKVFSDGRMNVWRQNDFSAFETDLDISSCKVSYGPVFEKYLVETVLLPVNSTRRIFLLEKFFRRGKACASLSSRLMDAGWQKVYEDGVAQVLVKSQS